MTRLSVTLAILAEPAATVGWQTVRSAAEQIRSLAPGVVTLAILLYALNVLFCSLRWQAALRALGAKVGLATTTLGTLCGVFLNNVTPARVAGDVFRIGWLRYRERIELARGTASVAIDRFSDLVPIGFIAVVALPSLPGLGRADPAALLLGGIVVLVVAALLSWRVQGLGARLNRLRDVMVAAARQPVERLAAGLGFAVLAWVADLARLSLISQALGLDLSIAQAAALGVPILLGSLAPTLGGIGAVEGGLVAALVWLGAPTETAVAITIVERSISYGLSTAVGGATLLLLGGRKLVTALGQPSPAPLERPAGQGHIGGA